VAAALLIEAIDTLLAIADAILAWIAVAAFVVTVLLFTVVLTGASVWRAIRRRHAPATAPQRPSCDSSDASNPQRPARARTVPSWVREEHDHQEAA